MSKVRKALLLSSDSDIVLKLSELIWDKTEPADKSFSSLTAPERNFLFMDIFDGQVKNGGFRQFFYASSGNYVYEILDACKIIKAEKAGELLTRAVSHFPATSIAKDMKERRVQMEQLTDNAVAEWRELDAAYAECDENIDQLLVAYIKGNIDEIGR
ncbi:DMP19 family protein [Chitinophaga rhizophila]|uniref:DMP19 family protein n=1 Tax=Chitinophaga rhizophila TaxID=2866212 RepID=A0ABS7G842_9BACT|nr:DUF4375 domain-containing protein [Chitinophaga rhizophila]MBW8682892.1 DMP19 family protein [Chitinophaga rhizophila]